MAWAGGDGIPQASWPPSSGSGAAGQRSAEAPRHTGQEGSPWGCMLLCCRLLPPRVSSLPDRGSGSDRRARDLGGPPRASWGPWRPAPWAALCPVLCPPTPPGCLGTCGNSETRAGGYPGGPSTAPLRPAPQSCSPPVSESVWNLVSNGGFQHLCFLLLEKADLGFRRSPTWNVATGQAPLPAATISCPDQLLRAPQGPRGPSSCWWELHRGRQSRPLGPCGHLVGAERSGPRVQPWKAMWEARQQPGLIPVCPLHLGFYEWGSRFPAPLDCLRESSWPTEPRQGLGCRVPVAVVPGDSVTQQAFSCMFLGGCEHTGPGRSGVGLVSSGAGGPRDHTQPADSVPQQSAAWVHVGE